MTHLDPHPPPKRLSEAKTRPKNFKARRKLRLHFLKFFGWWCASQEKHKKIFQKKNLMSKRTHEMAFYGPQGAYARVAKKAKTVVGSMKGFRKTKLSADQRIFKFKRWVDIGNINATSMADTFGVINVRLADLPNQGEFATLFDQYRITKLNVVFIPNQNYAVVASVGSSTTKIMTAIDYDDATAWTNVNDALQYESLLISNFDEKFSRKFKPKTTSAVFDNSQNLVSQTSELTSKWLDIANANAQYFGLKYALTQTTSSFASGWRVYMQVSIELKNVR